MCGITGIITNGSSPVHVEELKKMTNVIVHRGPDGEGHWINPSAQVGFGHRRLSILDLSAHGSQPMHYMDRYTITFNGEIYNYLEIRDSLIKKGYQFTSSSDTEVLLALYDAEKENCLSYLDGMFAFAIWDEIDKTIFFARDRFGEKPFHYAFKDKNSLVFASEMKSLWVHGVDRKTNNTMIYRYLVHNELMNPEDLSETFYENVFRLKAAHYGKFHLADWRLEIKRYWDINYLNTDDGITEKQAMEQLRELLYTSVRRRMRSDVPVGSSLSGGLDSSLIVCIMDEVNTQKEHTQNTFSARFPGYIRDEGHYMQLVVDKAHVTPHYTFPDEMQLLSSIDTIMHHQEEPFGSASIFAQYEVMKLAREKNVTVLLDGQGADEILAGYHHYYHTFFHELKKHDRSSYKQQLKQYQSLHHQNNINAVYHPGVKSFLKGFIPGGWLKVMKSLILHSSQTKSPFLHNDFYKTYRSSISSNAIEPRKLNDILYSSVTGAGLQDLLRYADRNSMAHSREVRLPFLSHLLVEFLFTLPARYKMHDGWTKFIMRKTFEDILPREITWRKDKIGYDPPQAKWLNDRNVQEKIQAGKERLAGDKILAPNLVDTQIDPTKAWKVLMLDSFLHST